MSSEEYRFMLWIQTPEGHWTLWSRSRRRDLVERELKTVPPGAAWRLVGLHDGLLAESASAANQNHPQ